MATDLAIDPELLDRALAVGGLGTKTETVTLALREFVARRARAGIVASFGTLEWEGSYERENDRRDRDARHIGLEVWSG